MRMLSVGLLVGIAVAAVAATPSQTCQLRKNKEAGNYTACRYKAEAKRVLTGSDAAYGAAIGKCAASYAGKWPLIERKAAGSCPSNGDEVVIQGAIDTHTSAVATALAGGTLPDCAGDLSTCHADLDTCTGALAATKSPILATGETTCSDTAGTEIPCAGTGQDGELQNGVGRAYTDNGDGTITDVRTGLVWEKLSADGGIHDKDTRYTFSDAFVKIAALNAGGGFAGYTDWRLPNVNELRTLVDFGASALVPPEFNAGCVPGCTATTCSCTQSINYRSRTWSSSVYWGVQNNAWVVSFSDGALEGWEKGTAYPQVRAVRGGLGPSMAVAAPLGANPPKACQSNQNKEAGGYAFCRYKAEAKRALKGDDAAYGMAIAKCATKYAAKWSLIEAKAKGACPSNADEVAIQGAIDTHTAAVATAIAGGTLPDCAGDLTTCHADLGTCTGKLAAAQTRILQTGQTTCWDDAGTEIPCAGTGQDGELQTGVGRAYADNGDGTITDLRTGLMWEKASDDGGIHDKDTPYTWSAAFAKIAALNAGGGFAGHTDWRLPNVNELQTIVSYAARNPSVPTEFDTGCVPGCPITTCSCSGTNISWTSSAYGVPSSAWTVNFYDGGSMGHDKSEEGPQARAVRGGS